MGNMENTGSLEGIHDSSNEGLFNKDQGELRSLDELSDIEIFYLDEVKDDPDAYSSRLDELGIEHQTPSDFNGNRGNEMVHDKDFQENYDDNLIPLEDICDNIERGKELTIEELKEIRPDLARYIESTQDRLKGNDYAQSIIAYYCENGDIIFAGKDDRTRQESNYAVVRGNDIYLYAGNAKGDGHLNEFANNTDGYIPNSRYHFENVTYVTNEYGQVKTVYEHHVTSRPTDRNEERGDLKSVCDAKGGLASDVGGHIVAHNIDGPTEAINIIPMDKDFNNGGEWKAMENELKNEYENGRSFTVKKEIQYDAETGRPNNIDVVAEIDGKRKEWIYDLP